MRIAAAKISDAEALNRFTTTASGPSYTIFGSGSLSTSTMLAERKKSEAVRKQREEELAKSLGIKIENKKEVDAAVTNTKDYELKESGRILADLILSKVG